MQKEEKYGERAQRERGSRENHWADGAWGPPAQTGTASVRLR